ncbi:MAG TPA: transglutaminase domain-containing protein [Solirubrobacteraceae bacterium]|nr:transglutaminase domain-containing protein [Solirubrobacteraceae bacterium]
MSAGAPVADPGKLWVFTRWRDAAPVAEHERPWLRTVTFAALAGYGVERWSSLVRPAPTWRLVGLLALAVAMAGLVPWLARRSRPVAGAVTFLLVLFAFPVAGLRWHWFTHLRIAVSADRIGNGLQALPNALVPYLGTSHAIRLVIVLGAAVLLLDAAAVVAFGGRAGSDFGDGRRAAAALPLIALAIVPSTLIRPEFPYLQGLILFALLAAFMWGERVRRGGLASAIAIVAVAGVGGAIAAPRIDQGTPWVDYRAWAGTLTPQHVDSFDWNQTYGPLRWPKEGHEVLSVQARTPEYWKAEDLDDFNGYSWVAGDSTVSPELAQPSVRYTKPSWYERIRVTILGMQTRDVIAAGYSGQPSLVSGGVAEGEDPGTWVAAQTMGPGTAYDVDTYSPKPTPSQMARATRGYPAVALSNYLTLSIPQVGVPAGVSSPSVQFALFHTAAPPSLTVPGADANATTMVENSPYGPAYRLARELEATARTPYAFVEAVQRYLSVSNGFAYTENPAGSQYPLESFLFATKDGYCQQFSGAMALLLRMGGIPARVASGFTAGTQDTSTGHWVVSDIDAHAWVEVWFPRYGWVRFDPTPTAAPARGGAAAPPIVKGGGALAQANGAVQHRDVGNPTAPAGVSRATGGGGLSWWLIALLAVVVAVAVTLIVLRARHLRRRPHDLLSELERALARTRRPIEDGVTLATLERRVSSSPQASAYVRTLSMARYGGTQGRPTAAERRALRVELARGLGLSGRLRAFWALPPWVRPHRAQP